MPGFDRTGPLGYGPLTGRGLGLCGRGTSSRRGFRRLGRGFRRGFGRGFGWRAWESDPYIDYPAETAPTKEEERKYLEEDLKEIGLEKKEIEKRLKELK